MDAPPVQYVKTSDGYDIAYCVSGEGRPLIFMWDMPLGCAELLWRSPIMRTFFEPMASRFRLVQFDSRGSGNSTRNLREGHSCEDYVLDLEAVVDRLGLEAFVLFAPVNSSHVATRYTVRHPGRVDGLILLNPFPPENPWVGMKNWEELYTNSWDMFLTSFTKTFYIEGSEVYLRKVTTQADFLMAARALAASRVEEMLPLIATPALILASREPVWPPLLESARAWASHMPNARLVLLDGQGNDEIVFPGDSGQAPAIRVVEEFVNNLPATQERKPSAGPLPHGLSARELEVLRLLAAGKSNQQIADELVISLNTVRRHVSNVFDKTGVANRTEASIYARNHGLA
ncbi:MAG TPA: alpha/beta fold hydrolase [Dehalococcoidia bacterium]|nr:alpha/beta fold hydrolase [Dehalococcoidia bacterium]